jgi:hypothetical protein
MCLLYRAWVSSEKPVPTWNGSLERRSLSAKRRQRLPSSLAAEPGADLLSEVLDLLIAGIEQ